MHSLIATVLALTLLTPAQAAVASRQDQRGAGSNNPVIVVLKSQVGSPRHVANDLAQRLGLKTGYVYQNALNGFSAVVPEKALLGLSRDPRVAYIEPDHEVWSSGVPTGVDRIELDKHLGVNDSGSNVQVNVDIAILDTGISTHPDLNIAGGVSCSGATWYRPASCSSGGYSDGNGHGTHVAGTAAAKDGNGGVVGVAPGARLWAVKVLSDSGSGSISGIIAGIDWVTANASMIEVANMSLGCECSSSALDQAISNSTGAGVVYTVAAGNSGKDAATFSPASHPEVITVSAMADFDGLPGGLASPTCRSDVGADEEFATFSNYGSVVDIAAPGVCITSTWPGGGYARISGTSMASPHAAGAAALYIVENGVPRSGNRWSAVRGGLQSNGWSVPQSDTCGFVNGKSSERFLMLEPCDGAVIDDVPSVNITSPASGASVSGTISVSARASDDIGVDHVQFFINGASIGTDTDGSNGWSVSWNTGSVGDGDHTISATATDTIGQTASDSISVSVDNVDSMPSVSITSPDAGDVISGNVTVTASASDDNGVNQVEFFVDGVSIGADTSSSGGWSVSWDTAGGTDGGKTLTAVATDSIGQTKTSAGVNVTVDNTAPSVSIASPTGGEVSGTATVSANASDLTSGVSQVQFFADGASIGTDTDGSNGWSVSWNTSGIANGDYDLTARATDGAGNTTTSSAVTVTVNNQIVTTALHVENLTGSSSWLSRYYWQATVTVTINDANGQPVSDATVTGSWRTGGDSTCTTGSQGTCQLTSGPIIYFYSATAFEITGVSHPTLAYDSNANKVSRVAVRRP